MDDLVDERLVDDGGNAVGRGDINSVNSQMFGDHQIGAAVINERHLVGWQFYPGQILLVGRWQRFGQAGPAGVEPRLEIAGELEMPFVKVGDGSVGEDA